MSSPRFLQLFAAISFFCLAHHSPANIALTQAQVDRAIELYNKAWGESDASARAALLEQVWAKGGLYKDPTVALNDAEALSQHIGEFLQQFPHARLTKTSKSDFYGTSFRSDWLLDFADGKTPVLEGFDYGELDNAGRITKIAGFFGPLPKIETAANETIVAKYLEALFTKFDYTALDKILSPGVVYKQAVGLPYGGTFIGLPEMVKMFTQSVTYSSMVVVGGWKLSTNPETKKVIASFTVRCTAKKSGKVLDMDIQESYGLQDGKITAIEPFYYDTKTFAEFVCTERAKE